ncbi:hypothetical protein [Spartinivicinus ruber]|uniref:hypothetical protein n=1 Tax=Spartinivicinus ruber TaxID=2683272 RepID=UPI0013D197CD|nr:hypothetical protein [Spartinivicinus ruber]
MTISSTQANEFQIGVNIDYKGEVACMTCISPGHYDKYEEIIEEGKTKQELS